MNRTLIVLSLSISILTFGCKKTVEVSTDTQETATVDVEAPTTADEAVPPAATTLATVTLPDGAPIPAAGVALWLVGDDAKGTDGKIASWTHAAFPGVTANADTPELQPTAVPNAIGGHAALRFDGQSNMLKTSVDISPAAAADVTIITVFNSATESPDPLRKLYGDDSGGFDRAVGLDSRAGEKNYGVFTGRGVEGYFALKAGETYLTVDQYTATDFSGWVNGAATLTKVPAGWDEALPNLYIGGTGTSYDEPWQGDIAEIIVYGRVLTEAERMQVEDYLGAKYGVAINRAAK